MKTPYIKHFFGDEVNRKLRSQRGWLTTGVASSITWPSLDVCVQYAGDEYFLRGSERDGKPSPPGITIACNNDNIDGVLSKIYRFTSILSWFFGGYVYVSGYVWGSHPILMEMQEPSIHLLASWGLNPSTATICQSLNMRMFARL